jgi:hypothetical protein
MKTFVPHLNRATTLGTPMPTIGALSVRHFIFLPAPEEDRGAIWEKPSEGRGYFVHHVGIENLLRAESVCETDIVSRFFKAKGGGL